MPFPDFRALRNIPVSKEDIVEAFNREAHPLLRQIREWLVGLRSGAADGYAWTVVEDSAGALSPEWRRAHILVTPDASAATNTSSINAAIERLNAAGGGIVELAGGTFLHNGIVLRDNVALRGSGKGATVLLLEAGSNVDSVSTFGVGTTDAEHFEISCLTIDGNYLEEDWDAASNVVNNSSGHGLHVQGRRFKVDVEIRNVAEIGMWSEENATDQGVAFPSSDIYFDVSLSGRVYGKEALVWQGPPDGILRTCIMGYAGILPRPTAHTTVVTSTLYSGEPLDGIVFDSVSIEVDLLHIYTCYWGAGLRTRNSTTRLEANHIISESNRSAADLAESTTVGCINLLSVRNHGKTYIHWTGPAFSYSPDTDGNDDTYDAVTVRGNRFMIGNYMCRRTIVTQPQVKGWCALVVLGAANNINMTLDTGNDPDTGAPYIGRGVFIGSDGNFVRATLYEMNGVGIRLKGRGNTIEFTDTVGRGGYAFERDGGSSNENTGNQVRGSIYSNQSTRGAFNSVQGTPLAESIQLTGRLASGATVFTGTVRDIGRAQFWDLSFVTGSNRVSNKAWLEFDLDESTTTEQTPSIAHGCPYTPDPREVTWSLENPGARSDGVIEYISLISADATNLNFATKMSTARTTGVERNLSIKVG